MFKSSTLSINYAVLHIAIHNVPEYDTIFAVADVKTSQILSLYYYLNVTRRSIFLGLSGPATLALPQSLPEDKRFHRDV